MIIIDVEIKKAILSRNETPLPGIEYCGGWRDFAGMGISCVCTFDINTNLSRVFLEEDLGDLAVYLHGKATSGFNTKRFDNPLLHEHGVDISDTQGGELHYDMLEAIWVAQGFNPDKFNPHTHGGWGLDAVCQATLGIAKTGHGAMAPVWWQQGQRGKVIDYCLNDVWMEGQLLLHILMGGLITAAGKDSIRVTSPHSAIGAAYGQLQARAFGEIPETVAAQLSPGQYTQDGKDITSQVTGGGGLGIVR